MTSDRRLCIPSTCVILGCTPSILICAHFHFGVLVSPLRKEKKNYTRVITPQAWITETETLLSDGEVLTLPGGFEPATPKSLA